MNDHPHDALPALALGALDTDEALQVIAHVSVCSSCRDDVDLWATIITLLPYMAVPSDPPAQIKHRLFALVEAAAPPASARARPYLGGLQRWMNIAAAGGVTLALVFGLLFFNMRQHADMLNTQVAERDQTLKHEKTLFGKQMLFASAAWPRPLAGRQPEAGATMFVKPGDQHTMLVVWGLKPLATGQVYQFWFATADQQIPSKTFIVDSDGVAIVEIDAPEPISHYTQVMVTVESAGDIRVPSDQVVLQAPL
jgi:hypothetical protein